MKVSEAKEKLCPFMSIGFVADTYDLRGGGLIEITCRCGDCMAWVYTDTTKYILPKSCDKCGREWESDAECKRHEGFCPDCGNETSGETIDLSDDDKHGFCARIVK